MKLIYIVSLVFVLVACGTKSNSNKKTEKETVEATKPSCSTCTASADEEQTCSANSKTESGKVTVYYFHGDRRCATCKAVGAVAQKTVEEKFADNANVEFRDVNIDREENKTLAEKMKITGSSLCIGNSANAENITVFAFSNARKNPEALKQKIESIVTSKLK